MAARQEWRGTSSARSNLDLVHSAAAQEILLFGGRLERGDLKNDVAGLAESDSHFTK